MLTMNRRCFLAGSALGAATAAAETQPAQDLASAIDFRYAPLSGQTAFCFPDDHQKSLVGERGELRYPRVTVEFSARGMESDRVTGQRLESPAVPIVHTRIERPEAYLELTTFATNRGGEGRVDNVLLEIRPRSAGRIYATPLVILKTKRDFKTRPAGALTAVHLDSDAAPFLVADSPLAGRSGAAAETALMLKEAAATMDRPLRYLLRFPQEGQDLEKIRGGFDAPERLLEEARAYWQAWRPFAGAVNFTLPGRYHEFLVACARNIQQAREVRDGRLTFQVGPTVYRGLWVVDGNFILESARYLGYDAEAQQGLEATWARQEPEGGIFAGGGREHWKDTGIAIFTLVRQAELSQDSAYFRKMQPEILRATGFLRALCEKARAEGSASGRYGLLPRGFGDGGLRGLRSEFTNTLWVLAGLKAVSETAARLKLAGFEPVENFHRELRAAFFSAARQEMRRHAAGFEYLPMLMKEDPDWEAPDERARPRPQVAQWALSHAIYPGLVFEKNDPVVSGHLALMQACTQEGIPAETGWIPHEGLWNYNAAFVAHVYLWAGLAEWARLTFHGFLNHATPLYCWREEQPLRGALTSGYVGDMPHNWASAECVLFLRHMLALEDGPALRLLPGVGDFELAAGEPLAIAASPTRFGRLTMELEPSDGRRAWRLKFERAAGPAPGLVELPAALADCRFDELTGAGFKREGGVIHVAPEAKAWTAVWRR